MAGWARPVRMVANSSLATATAFSIFSSAPKRISSITVAPVGPLPAGRLWPAWHARRVWPACLPGPVPAGPAGRRASALYVLSARRYPSPPRQGQQQTSRLAPRGPAEAGQRSRGSAGLAHLEPGERAHGHSLLGQDLLDGLLRVLDEGLLGEHDVLEEGTQPTLDDLADRLLGLAFLAGHLLRDAPLVLDHVAGHLVASDILRPHRGNLLRDILARLLGRHVQLYEHPQGRRQGAVGPVQVAGYIAALEQGVPAEFQLLLERGARLLDELLGRRAGPNLDPEQCQPVGRPVRQRGVRDIGRHLLEQFGLGHEVGLAVELDKDPGAGTVQLRGDEPVGRDAAGPLPDVLGALHAKDLDGGVEVPAGLLKRLLAVEHPSGCRIT